MDASVFLDHLRSLPDYRGQIAHLEHLQPRPAQQGDLDRPLHPLVQGILEQGHLLPLYRHQAAAINAARSGKNVIVSTPSASGKTLCYNLPVLDALLVNKGSRALYLFPTKALAQDQLRVLDELTRSTAHLSLKRATFDGDTPQNQRAAIRRSAQIVLSNPDTVHLGILPNHRLWAEFIGKLAYLVIDEAHVYRGIFGSHVANVIRRLRRICARYGSNPTIICCSATIANPEEHAQNLTGLPFMAIGQDGSRHGGKHFVLWNPPFVDEERSIRRSASSEASQLLAELVSAGIRSLAFARSRKLVELICIYVKNQLALSAPELAERVKPYRGGYLAADRREIEKELFAGRLLAAVATNALELGIDVGDLDATVLVGYPGSISSTWQQAGRAGRGARDSLSILVASDNPLDQYLMRHPDALFGRTFEHALIAPANPHVRKPHLLCAAWEFPLSSSDRKYFGDLSEMGAALETEGVLRRRGTQWYPAPLVAYPAGEVDIRSASSQHYALIDSSSGQVLETTEAATAFFRLHPGSIHLHQGEAYLITELDLNSRVACASPTDATYHTDPRETTELRILATTRTKLAGRIMVCLGTVEITTQIRGFTKRRIFTEEVIGEEPLNLPPQSYVTEALWFDLPSDMESILVRQGLDSAGGLHAAEHASIALLPLFALCDRSDIGGVSALIHPDTARPQIFIYDAHPGGVGIAEKGFDLVEGLWRETLKLVSGCPCVDGCPSCIYSPKCGNNNQPLDKKAAQAILEMLLEPGEGTSPT